MEEDEFHFEAEAVSVTAIGCPSLMFTCTVGNGFFTGSRDLLICQKGNFEIYTNTTCSLCVLYMLYALCLYVNLCVF